ncbi:hypothetical protein BGY98DRAFT_930625 [Russula aff. rugulosa BPL654]|nr:hypothetical protein BGY98DRAFT_930625 [Russula aff. rugulosa BPL654]
MNIVAYRPHTRARSASEDPPENFREKSAFKRFTLIASQSVSLGVKKKRDKGTSGVTEVNIDSAAKRSQWSRIYQTIFRIGQLLKQGKAEGAKENFQSCLSKTPPGNMHPSPRRSLYERGIAEFLNYEHFKGALELHREMNTNGMFASHKLRAKLLVCSSIVKPPREQEQDLESLFDKLSHILSLPSYSQPCRFSRSMGELELNTINKLILFYAHVGDMDAAESLVASQQDPSPVRRLPANPGPYTTLISSLVKRGALATRCLDTLLDKVEQSQIRVDLPFFSVLVQRAVQTENYHQAFALYDTILRQEGPHMIPDSFVFGSLLNALQRIWTCRSPSLRRARCPPNAPTPRRFFRQMLECHLLAMNAANPRPPARRIIRSSTLNISLRLFMLCMDYPAAFVTLRTFDLLGLKPDLRSYRFVLTILSARIRRAVLDADKLHWSHASWVANLLGGDNHSAEKALNNMGNTASELDGETQSGEDKKKDIRINTEIARGLLEFGNMNSEYRTPTVEMMMGEEEEPPPDEKAKWDFEPLERLVAKALLASVVPKNASEEQAGRALRKKMAPYFYEMVPEKLLIGRRLREPRL